jgi:hypothetical protein
MMRKRLSPLRFNDLLGNVTIEKSCNRRRCISSQNK